MTVMENVPIGMVLTGPQVAYVPVPKAGCTSMLWTLADLQGEQFANRNASLEPETSRTMLVHDAALWQHTNTVEALTRAEVSAICDDEDWFVFTLTRHPVDRLFGAWGSKLLCREPTFVRRFEQQPWFPSKPSSHKDIVADFGRFVTALLDDPTLRRADRHWQPQLEIMHADWVRYTHIGRTDSYAATLTALQRHLQHRGRDGIVTERRENKALIGLANVSLPRRLIESIEQIYAEDMQQLGYKPRRLGPPTAPVSGPLLLALQAIIDRNERIGDLLELARRQ
jgi:hypothetical protein